MKRFTTGALQGFYLLVLHHDSTRHMSKFTNLRIEIIAIKLFIKEQRMLKVQVQWRRIFTNSFLDKFIDFIRLYKERKRRHDVMDAAMLCYILIIHFPTVRHSACKRIMACWRKFSLLLENDTRWTRYIRYMILYCSTLEFSNDRFLIGQRVLINSGTAALSVVQLKTTGLYEWW